MHVISAPDQTRAKRVYGLSKYWRISGFSAAIAGQKSVDEALDQAQGFAESVARTYGWEG